MAARLRYFGDPPASNEEHVFENGTKKAHKVLKKKVHWYDGQRDSVVAIDFGTSTLAVAWQNKDGEIIDLHIHDNSKCIPTVLLLRGNNRTEIGDKAMFDYENVYEDCPATPIFFEKVKMELQHEKTINRNSSVIGSNGKSYYLIEVIALILKRVRLQVQDFFDKRFGRQGTTADTFSWILTVPALWGNRARAMMREAAYLAGLCTECQYYDEFLKLPLKTTEEHPPPEVRDERDPHRLSLVFEPEAAAAYCMHLSKTNANDKTDFTQSLSAKDNCFLTVDVGGGTIDITAHQVNKDDKPIVFALPHGQIYGGSRINNAFIQFLEETTMQKMEDYYQIGNNSVRRRAEIQKLKNKVFEETKKYFADDESMEFYSVDLPTQYCHQYGHALKQMGERYGHFQFIRETNQIRLSKSKMKEFAMGCLYQIKECIKSALHSIEVKPDIMYLVGGFGGSNFVIDYIQEEFRGIRMVIPQYPDLAVVRGACLYFRNKPIRTADATYGTVCKLPFDKKNKVHKEAERVVGEGETEYCTSLFKPFVQIGEQLHPDYVYKTVYAPIKEDQTTLLLTLYSTKEKYVHFAEKDRQVCPGMTKLGCLFVDLLPMRDVPLQERYVKLLVDFSSVEITISAHYTCDGIERKLHTSTDFLSTVEKMEEFKCVDV